MEGNILDLVLTTQPPWVKSTSVLPGFSDHKAVLCEMTTTYEKMPLATSRKIFNYARANVEDIDLALQNYFPEFEELSETVNMNDLWLNFKSEMLQLRDHFVPSWIQSSRRSRSKPWFNAEIRSIYNARQKIYKKYRKEPTSFLLAKLQAINKRLKTEIRQGKQIFFDSFPSRLKKILKSFGVT